MTADMASEPVPQTLADPLAEALRVIDLCDARGLQVRLLGGMAVRAHAPDWTARSRKVEVDLDFATRGKDRPALFALLEAEGYTPDKRHNALFGGAQGYFMDVARHRPVDVVVDKLEMCHRIEFANRLGASKPTIPLAELLLSKLQIVQINRKDVLDAMVLLAEHPLGQDDGDIDARTGLGSISLPRLLSYTSNDWGWWRTVTGNLERLAQFLDGGGFTAEDLDLQAGRPPRFDPAAQVAALQAAIANAPKSTRWNMRARVGERVKWYQEPEEVGHGPS
ncbi:MAG: hypothetical protein HYX57_04270 [Chloroflexi bacterium]|nr:hypothetical protein [Chloroflexota bacterium]